MLFFSLYQRCFHFNGAANSLWSFSFSASEAKGIDHTQLQHFVKMFSTVDSTWLGPKGTMSSLSSISLNLRSPTRFKWIGSVSQMYLHFVLLRLLITRNGMKCWNRLPFCLCPLQGSVDRLPITHWLQKKPPVSEGKKRPDRRCNGQVVGFIYFKVCLEDGGENVRFQNFCISRKLPQIGFREGVLCIRRKLSETSGRNNARNHPFN